jgi:hypothetical protein
MFVEKQHIQYRGMCGIVDFVCDQYLIMVLPAVEGRNSPRLLIYRSNYKEVISLKDSER